MKKEAVFDEKKSIAYKKESEKNQKKYEAVCKMMKETQVSQEDDTSLWTQLEEVPKEGDPVPNETVK